MQSPGRKRPLTRQVIPPPDVEDWGSIVDGAIYVGSSEHKSYPSFAGPPALRFSDASPCPTDLKDQDELTRWLRAALRSGLFGPRLAGNYPEYVWLHNERGYFEARLTNRELGWYKGYPISQAEFESIRR